MIDDALQDAAVVDLVHAALASVGDRRPADAWRWVHDGSANLVVLTEETAVRVGRSAAAAVASRRAQRLVDRIAPLLPFPTPTSLGDPVEHGGRVAIPQRRLHGGAHPIGSGDPSTLGALLEAVAALPVDELRGDLARPRSFMGGADWFEVMTLQAIPRLAPDVRAEALARAEALRALPATPATAIVHGDLAGGNVLWVDGAVAGVLDWDLAAIDDPAVDVAALAGWHGWEALPATLDARVVARARVIAATHPLQAICFAVLAERPERELRTLVDRVDARLRRESRMRR